MSDKLMEAYAKAKKSGVKIHVRPSDGSIRVERSPEWLRQRKIAVRKHLRSLPNKKVPVGNLSDVMAAKRPKKP